MPIRHGERREKNSSICARRTWRRITTAPDAPHYLGVSESTLRLLEIPRRKLGAKRLYDRFDLDAFASALPIEGESEGETVSDHLFGVSS